MTFLSKVLEFLIPASNGFWVMNAFVKKVIFAYGIFWKICLMALAPGLITIFHFSFQFPLYFLKIYNFELINCFRFRLPYTSSGNPFCLCKNIWAYSVEGIWKCNLFFVGKVGKCWGLALCKVLGDSCAWFFSIVFFFVLILAFFGLFHVTCIFLLYQSYYPLFEMRRRRKISKVLRSHHVWVLKIHTHLYL